MNEEKRKDILKALFNKTADTYDQVGPPFFSYFGNILVEHADIPEGVKILDVATGRGAVLLPAAQKIGASGEIIGIDLSTEMLRNTESLTSGMSNISVMPMDAENLEFPDNSFDFVLCGFGIFLFPGAMDELLRVLKPGGRFGCSTFFQECAYMKWFMETLIPYLPEGSPFGKSTPTVEELRDVLKNTNFEKVEVIKKIGKFLYTDEEEWWQSIWSLPVRGLLENMQPETLEKFKTDIFQKLQVLKSDNGLDIPINALFAFGIKPGE